MKAMFTAALLLGAATASADLADLLDRKFEHFSLRASARPKQLGKDRISKSELRALHRERKQEKNLGADVSGYKVEFFQYITQVEESYSANSTQFGTWYKDDTTNNTRTEVVTYSIFNSGGGDRTNEVPVEYFDIGGIEYQIKDADPHYVYCEAIPNFPDEDLSYEYLGYAFFVPIEKAYPIVWGPRLMQLYKDPTTEEDTVAYYGNDAFNGEPVVFVQYNTTYSQTLVWSKIRQEEITSTDFNVPSGLTCTNKTTEYVATPYHDRALLDALHNSPWF